MDYKEVFVEILSGTNEIALATSADGTPNVRIVNFCFESGKPEVLYFAADRDNRKVAEIKENNKVAFTTVPREGIPHARSNDAIAVKSGRSIDGMKDLFIARVPGYDETIAAIGDCLDVFEIHIKNAFVVVDFENSGPVSF
jgi:uncharacterized pyridoxamine 5'-phosphate oxidase family protein